MCRWTSGAHVDRGNGLRRAVAVTALILLPAAGWCVESGAAAPVTKLERKDGPTGITSWLYAGTFPSTDLPQPGPNGPRRTGYDTDFLTAIGGEAAARPHEGTRIATPKGEVEFKRRTWNRFTNSLWHTDYIDLTQVFGHGERVCAYLYAEVESPRDTSLYLHFSSNDAGKVWINGQLTATRPEDGPVEYTQRVVAVNLKSGRNPVLVKVDQDGRNWGTRVEFWDRATSLTPGGPASLSPEQAALVEAIASALRQRDVGEMGQLTGVALDKVLSWRGLLRHFITFALLFGWIPLLIWLRFRSRERREQREHEMRMGMAMKGVPPVTAAAERKAPPRVHGRGLVIWGLLLALVGLGLTIAEVADSGLRNAGFELTVMFAGIALIVAAEYLRRTSTPRDEAQEPPASPPEAV